MNVTRFDVVQPATVDEAIEHLIRHGDDAQLIAGGTDLLRDIRLQAKRPRLLVSLDRIAGLAGIQEESDGSLSIGPMTTMATLARDTKVAERFTALSEAAAWMGSPQVRNRATFGGNLCNARPCADTAPPAIVCDAVLMLRGQNTQRLVKANGFMTGPGRTTIGPGEILERIRFPRLQPFSGSAFVTVTNRKALEITITSAAARITLDSPDGAVLDARICLGSVAPTPVRAPSAEAILAGQEPTDEVLTRAAAAAVNDCSPIDDLRGTAAYRKWMVKVLVSRALTTALTRAWKGAA